MKQIITHFLASFSIKKVLDLFQQNRRVVLVLLVGTIFVDTVFVRTSSDVVMFGVLLLFGISSKVYRLKARVTFLLCLGLLGVMFVCYLMGGSSSSTEKAAVWLVLFMALGIYQQWRE